jgi:hypothetical protein
MRKKGRTALSVRACGSARQNDVYILGIESQSRPILLTLLPFAAVRRRKPLLAK